MTGNLFRLFAYVGKDSSINIEDVAVDEIGSV